MSFAYFALHTLHCIPCTAFFSRGHVKGETCQKTFAVERPIKAIFETFIILELEMLYIFSAMFVDIV